MQIDSLILNHSEESLDSRYINPRLDETEEYIYIPCGFGRRDNGFLIHGIEKTVRCDHKDANIFALVYNYLVRNSAMTEEDIPRFIREKDAAFAPDYQSIYRLAITMLQLVRHNRCNNGRLVISYTEDKESLSYATGLINHYAALFCRLIGIAPVTLRVENRPEGISLSLNRKADVFITENTDIHSNARELWYGRKINYRLTKENLPDLEYILSEISSFKRFREGQFSALCDMLACKRHAVCIMPTGSGKSLLFYMASLLQPLPLFIVAPTDILIRDQIRNLKAFHHIDNVAHLQLLENGSFKNWDIHNSLNYLTPMTFQNRDLLVKFRYLNSGTKQVDKIEKRIAAGALVSYVVLDEIHCLSNWGHDFRPEYLMLSKYLNEYFDHIAFWGFTATANYTVVDDIQKQLNIPQECFFSPIAFEHYNVDYVFRAFQTEAEMLDEAGRLAGTLAARDERTIVFTKNDEISRTVAEAIGYEADVFLTEDPTAYYHFAAGESRVLVASDELGIGVNLPNIRNIIHFGLPLSKNEYIQEIGRAGRADEDVTSYVLYLKADENNVPAGLLKRDTPISNLPGLLEGYRNDYAEIYRKLSNGAISDDELLARLMKSYTGFTAGNKAQYILSYPYETLEIDKQNLYMLYLVGFIRDWYTYAASADGTGVDILVDICSADYYSYMTDPQKMLRRMKNKAHEYYIYMGNCRESIVKTERAKTPEEIITVYVKWYYEQYLYHHNEQFLDLYEFILKNMDHPADEITEEIKTYFVLPFAKIKKDETTYNELSIEEIIYKSTTGVSKTTLANLERINSRRYSYKMDVALFCGQLRMNDIFDESRLNRILAVLSYDEIVRLGESLSALYGACGTPAKIKILNYMTKNARDLKTDYPSFLKKAYSSGKKDEVYYGIMAAKLNNLFGKMRRENNV